MPRKKSKKVLTEEELIQNPVEPVLSDLDQPSIPAPEPKSQAKKQKFNIGAIVYISNDAETDLNGFKLFPQYKKYTYTIETYDENSEIYTLRRLNLLLNLPESLILAPEERAHDSLHRRQF